MGPRPLRVVSELLRILVQSVIAQFLVRPRLIFFPLEGRGFHVRAAWEKAPRGRDQRWRGRVALSPTLRRTDHQVPCPVHD